MDPSILQPGDVLLYRPTGVFGIVISLKTWHPIAHCECYVGDGWSVASRDGAGVGKYPLRTAQLGLVLRPNEPVNLEDGMKWFKTVEGQRYDWFGLLRFAWRSKVIPNKLDNRQFCSEFLARFFRHMGLDLFNKQDADAVAPFQFTYTPLLTKIWSDGKYGS